MQVHSTFVGEGVSSELQRTQILVIAGHAMALLSAASHPQCITVQTFAMVSDSFPCSLNDTEERGLCNVSV